MKIMIPIVLCLCLCLGLTVPVLAAGENENVYTIEVKRNSTNDNSTTGAFAYDVVLTHTTGDDALALLAVQIGCVAEAVNAVSTYGAVVKYANNLINITMDKLSEPLAIGTEGTVIASLNIKADSLPELTYESSENDSITNAGYQDEADLTVTVPGFITAPVFIDKGCVLEGTEAVYTLTVAPIESTTFAVYDEDGEEATGVTTSWSGTELTLTFDTAPTEAANYLIAARQGEQMESVRVPVSVYVESEDGYSVILPIGAPSNLILIEAQYAGGQMISATMPSTGAEFDVTAPYTLSLAEGADLCKLFVLKGDGSYAPYCANFVWPRS